MTSRAGKGKPTFLSTAGFDRLDAVKKYVSTSSTFFPRDKREIASVKRRDRDAEDEMEKEKFLEFYSQKITKYTTKWSKRQLHIAK